MAEEVSLRSIKWVLKDWWDEAVYRARYLPVRVREGYWPHECWDLGVHTARWVLPRLKHLRANLNGCPPILCYEEGRELEVNDGMAKWETILADMEWYLTLLANDDYPQPEEQERYERAAGEFGRWLPSLWT